MINRTIVRTKVLQTLFAYYQSEGKTPHTAHKELLKNFSNTYSLYIALLAFANELTAYAEQQIEEAEQRAKITHNTYIPNRRFVNNKVAEQLFQNRQLRHFIEEQHIHWEMGQNAITAVYHQLIETNVYKAYMSAEQVSYEDEKRIWKKVYSEIMPNNEDVASALEEMEIEQDAANWTVDLDVILSFVAKTIRRFNEDSDANTPLLNMFDTEDELHFGEKLLEEAIAHREEYMLLIKDHLKNWDADRVAYMDTLLLQLALTEIIQFPDIALEVSMNEYIELSKEYSSEKSYIFINGILNEILQELRKENKIFKQIRTK